MFKLALAKGRPQIGPWLALANPYTAVICGGAGLDWLLIDGEHAAFSPAGTKAPALGY